MKHKNRDKGHTSLHGYIIVYIHDCTTQVSGVLKHEFRRRGGLIFKKLSYWMT